MAKAKLSVREIQHSDIDALADYWFHSDPEYLTGLGVGLEKLPDRPSFEAMLEEQLRQPLEARSR